MRRLLLALPLFFAIPARAQSVKIGFVDVQRAYQEVEEGKSVRTRLQQELAQKRSDLDQRRSNLEKMKADYDKQAPVLSDDAKRKKQEELQKAFLEAQQGAQQMQEELQGKEQEAMLGINKRLQQIVNEIVDRENFNYVIDKAALLYAPAASDITNEVVRRYNDRFGGASKAGDKKASATPSKGTANPPKAAPAPPKK
jgi:outer membrane protein